MGEEMSRTKSIGRVLGAALVVGAFGSAANAALTLGVPVNDNFEYASQAAFEASWPAIGTVAPLSGELSTAQAKSPIKSIRNPATATSSQSRNRKTFAETGSLALGQQIVWSFDFYDSIAGNPQRNYSNLQDSTGPAASPPTQLLSLGLNNNQAATDSGGNYYMARVLGFAHTAVDPEGGPNEAAGGTGSGAYFKLNDYGVGLRSIGWHNLKLVITTDNTAQGADLLFYVDNQLAETVANVGDATALRSYDNIALGSGLSNGGAEAFFDNMQLQLLPEPGSLAVIGLGAVALGARRRRA
jgi:hypothetical protein